MALKYPRLALSHTVKGSCVVQVTTYGQLTLPEGVYWTDYLYGSTRLTPNLLGEFAGQIDDLTTVSSTAFSWANLVGKYSLHAVCDVSLELEFGHANTTEEMRRTAKRLGFNPLRTTDDLDGSGSFGEYGIIEGHWDCPRAEFSKLQEDQDKGNAATSESYSGYTYGFRMGDNLKRYLLRFQSVPEVYVYSRGQVQSGATVEDWPYDLSFESRVYQYLRRGEMVRLYADASATATYLTSAMTATAVTCVVQSATGIVLGDIIWVDGEEMTVEDVVGTTLTVMRPNPIAHPAYAPVSKDFVATYVLDTDGGNVNMQEFAPARRAHNQARYDLDIALRRTRWTG